VGCVGSGGTLGGVARYLREHAPRVRIVGAAPDRAGCAGARGGSLVEGVVDDLEACAGQGSAPDDIVTVLDRDAVQMTLRLAREEGILCGGSTGITVCAAVEVARRLGAGMRVVAIAPDTGRNYLSTYFNEEWRRAHGL
jgi:cystathionine beta-synthase